MKGENLLSGLPEHLRRQGKKLGGDANVVRVIKVSNPSNKTISVTQGEGGYRFELPPGKTIFLDEAGWSEMQKLWTTAELIKNNFKFEQEFREVEKK